MLGSRPASRRRPRTPVAVALVAVLALGVAGGWTWWSGRPDRWVDGSRHGPWRAVFDGEGRTTSDGSSITLSPRPAARAGVTHAGLVVSVGSYRDVRFSVRMHTLRQLRTGTAPNPWEVGWVVWHYEGPQRFYYFVLKPNGWELGKADPRWPGAQRFLATGPSPAEGGRAHDVVVRQVGATVTVDVDGAAVVEFTDTDSPYPGGSVGVYSEDAEVEFGDLTATPLP
ncbi:calcium-binding protein [Kineococcus sp. LSe6-4]|uniref:Calcium-binding protein n=1 Tax=Kineococcus halophytocola TaxID=3234027 RepID=A0ABV4GZL8_9ACTN